MSSTMFGILVLVSFVLPVPLLVWLDRPLRRVEGKISVTIEPLTRKRT